MKLVEKLASYYICIGVPHPMDVEGMYPYGNVIKGQAYWRALNNLRNRLWFATGGPAFDSSGNARVALFKGFLE